MKWILVAAMIFGSTMTMSSAQACEEHKKNRDVAGASATMTDTVQKVSDDDDGLVVYFVAAKGTYTIKKGSKGFDGLRKKLEASLSAKKPVSVTFDSAELNILEVK